MRRRDSQQWILDYVVKESGEAQNFEHGVRRFPEGVKNYRMIAKLMGEDARRAEAIARNAEERGHRRTAEAMYWIAVEKYRLSQHAIFEDDHPVKLALYAGLQRCFDHVIALSSSPIERIEVPFEGSQIQVVLHLLPDRRRAPLVLYIPGMDETKESAGSPRSYFLQRGVHYAAMDGPGQGMSNIRKIRITDDNYERAGKAVIDHLAARPEIMADRIGLMGRSMGSFWAPRIAAFDHRVAALVATSACYAPKTYIFDQASPRFKQIFMYMAGLTEDEDAFDRMADRMVLTGYASKITCPTLLVSGEFDPLSPVEYAKEVYDELAGPKELWVRENNFHKPRNDGDLVGAQIEMFEADWLVDRLAGRGDPDLRRTVYVREGGDGPYTSPFPADYPWRW
ncbi:MAG TPA: alpha/beta hydrolase [Candidatus Limnocylindria bacterium]|nr:alpha/beta hydrolase [Candidatus Limnocylindria bacterium]